MVDGGFLVGSSVDSQADVLLGAALCLGGVVVIVLVVITPTYLRAILGLH
jgi:hypothetical protein